MSNFVPQHSDFSIKFSNLTYNLSSEEVDLTDFDDIIVSICKGEKITDPTLVKKYTIEPGDFTIDNSAKSVVVRIDSSEGVTELSGKYSVNLYILNGGEYITHIKKVFEVVDSVMYE